MKPIYESHLIQIEVTNACTFNCANCTRMVGHHKEPYFMDLKTIEKAIDSLEGFPGGVGIMGGEPTLHPKFREICNLLQEKVPAHKCGLWTSGYKWEEYKDIIKDTFKYEICYNEHPDPTQKHQPILVGINEVIEDEEVMWRLINNCWVQEQWSASINPKGAFFCEVAAALDLVFDGSGGYPIEKGWWDKTPEEFRDQVERYCPKCGATLPLKRPSTQKAKDTVSKENYERLMAHNSPKALNGNVEIFEKKLDKEELIELVQSQEKQKPWDYLSGSVRKRDLKLDEVFLLLNPFRSLRRVLYTAHAGDFPLFKKHFPPTLKGLLTLPALIALREFSGL